MKGDFFSKNWSVLL